ncbi:MAG: adaptor protein MecA [Acetatifactor sp.]|nr:adaptor protein MecA [Acetatifactor sp.]
MKNKFFTRKFVPAAQIRRLRKGMVIIMKIERVDDKTVKCFLSNEELEEYEIDYKDFILRSEKAKQVVHDIIAQAAEQVGYKPPRFAFDMQIMMLPDQGLLLTFSESDVSSIPDARQILEYLKDMKQTLQKTKEQLGIVEDTAQTETPQSEKETAAPKPEKAVFAFESIPQLMDYAGALPANLRVKSALYEMDGKYYLYLQKGGASYQRYSRACIQGLEFGGLYSADETALLSVQEHGECLIQEKALQKLRG